MTLFVNEARIDSITMSDGARVYSFLTPQAAWKAGKNELRFEFVYAASPAAVMSGSADKRTLAAAFDWIELAPAPPAKR